MSSGGTEEEEAADTQIQETLRRVAELQGAAPPP